MSSTYKSLKVDYARPVVSRWGAVALVVQIAKYYAWLRGEECSWTQCKLMAAVVGLPEQEVCSAPERANRGLPVEWALRKVGHGDRHYGIDAVVWPPMPDPHAIKAQLDQGRPIVLEYAHKVGAEGTVFDGVPVMEYDPNLVGQPYPTAIVGAVYNVQNQLERIALMDPYQGTTFVTYEQLKTYHEGKNKAYLTY
ncbi:hypothetical protein [Polymorphospora lycopeni]|uniref:Uncharacterized protein n=1 Tax=Polymorphospora lycopeni TaxID=3140240 RepID=A0ABV5CZ42_9ACTN